MRSQRRGRGSAAGVDAAASGSGRQEDPVGGGGSAAPVSSFGRCEQQADQGEGGEEEWKMLVAFAWDEIRMGL